MTLVADVDFGVCAKLCLPAHAHLTLELGPPPDADARQVLDGALARVPPRSALGAPGPVGIDKVALDGPPADTVLVEGRGGPGAELFVEAPEGWYLQAGAAERTREGVVRFRLAVLQKPDGGDLSGADLRLTLADGTAAVDVTARPARP